MMRQLKIVKQIINRESQSLDKYLTEIAKIDLITSGKKLHAHSPHSPKESRKLLFRILA